MTSLPIETWVPIAVALLLGVALWAAGSRLVRAAFAALGFLVGVLLGTLLAEGVQLDVSPWVPALAGGLLLAFVANLAYRAAIAGGLALVLGLAAPAAIWIVSSGYDGEFDSLPILASPEPAEDGPPLLDQLDDWLADLTLPDAPQTPYDGTAEGPPLELMEHPLVEEHLEQARTLAQHVVDRSTEVWEQTPEPVQRRMIGVAIIASLAGFILGSLAAGFSASIVTAAGGASLGMSGIWMASRQIGEPLYAWLPDSPNAWLTWWVIITLIGLFIQWTLRPKRADKRP